MSFKIYLDGSSSGIVKTDAKPCSHQLIYKNFGEAKKALRDMAATHIEEYMRFRRRINKMKLSEVETEIPKYLTD